ncbi:unnamed protein product [Closterium sp. NIES-64]|nr:unnamed protein product [Closterium sp. NIES-64]
MASHSTSTTLPTNSSATIAAPDGGTSESLAAALFSLDDLPSPLASLHATLPPPPAAPVSQSPLPDSEHKGRFGWSPIGPRGFPEEGFALHAEPRSEPLNEPLAKPQMTAVGGEEVAGEAAAEVGLGVLTGLTGPASEAAAAAAMMRGAAGGEVQLERMLVGLSKLACSLRQQEAAQQQAAWQQQAEEQQEALQHWNGGNAVGSSSSSSGLPEDDGSYGNQNQNQNQNQNPSHTNQEQENEHFTLMNTAAVIPVPNERVPAPAARTPPLQVAAAAAKARREEVSLAATQKSVAVAAAVAAAAVAAAAAEARREEARREQAVLSSRVMATLQMGAGSEAERRQLLALLLALKKVEEQQSQEAQQQTQQKLRQNARKRQRRQRAMGGQGLSGNPQSPQVQQQEQQQPEQEEQEGRNEEHRFLASSPFLAGASPDLHDVGVMGRMDGRGGERSGSGGSSGGGSGIASGICNGVRTDPDFSLRGVGNDVYFSLRGVDKSLTSALSNEICLNAMRGINSGVFSGGAAVNVGATNAGNVGRKRSPDALDDGATAAPQWQHGMQTPAGCYSRSVLDHADQSGVLDGMLLKDADSAPVGAAAVGAAPAHPTLSPLHGSMAVAAGQHMHLLLQQQRLQQQQPLQQQQQQQQRCEQASQPLSPEARNQRSRGSAGSAGTGTAGEGSARSGSAGTGMGGADSAGGPATSSSGQEGGEEGTEVMREGMRDGMRGMEEMDGMGQWQSDEDLGEAVPARRMGQQAEWGSDALDNPKGRERGTMQDECGTDDEWLPRCQGVRTGSVPNKRIKSRSMAERRRRERISEGLQRLRAKVRGRGDTCAMLDRAVGYVDALERRVVELERVVMAAAGSGRNVFPGNAFAGGFAGRGFAA